MIYQNDKNALKIFTQYGCYFFSILAMLWREFQEQLKLPALLMLKAISIYEELQKNEIADVRADMLIENPQNTVDHIVGPGRIQFMKHKGGVNFPVDYVPQENDRIIQYWEFYKNGKLAGTHFTLAKISDPKATEYDPWYPASPWRVNGILAGYRIYRIVKEMGET
jgi:hypothetical protein